VPLAIAFYRGDAVWIAEFFNAVPHAGDVWRQAILADRFISRIPIEAGHAAVIA
jgi:hypothetical protein